MSFVINAKFNVVNAIATFITLAYSKILYTNYALLSSTQLFKSDRSQFQANVTTYILYNASVPYLGVEHKPYFILAISVFIVFNILPMLLLFLSARALYTLQCLSAIPWC